MKRFTFDMVFSAMGTVSIEVPDDFTIEQAIKLADETRDDISLPIEWDYLSDSAEHDYENCSFE